MTNRRKFPFAALLLAVATYGAAFAQTGTTAPGSTEEFTPTVGQSGKDVIWVPTPQALVDRMLDMAQLTPQDILVDLGSGDGRTVISAAQRGARARGIEFNPDMVALSRSAARRAGVSDRATFEQADIFESDFSDATVVTLFLLPNLNLRLRPTLLEMKPGTRVISNSFTMGDWEPDETAEAEGCSSYCVAYKWIVPARVGGRWKTPDGELQLAQEFQYVKGSLRKGNDTMPVTDGKLEGAALRFTVGQDQYETKVDGNVMEGTMNGRAGWKAQRVN